jgi:hypothetical protein
VSEATSERIDGRTPAGGVASVAYFLDAGGKPCPKGRAVSIEIHELDEGGETIARTYGQVRGRKAKFGAETVATPPVEMGG